MPKDRRYFVYVMASARNGTLYTGVTNDMARHYYEHREGLVSASTKKSGIKMLVWLEEHNDIREAIVRETSIKKWDRAWKLRLIESVNPDWNDLGPSS
jgi:putative endonuclease